MQISKVGTAQRSVAIACLFEKAGGSNGVQSDTIALLMHDSKVDAANHSVAVAGLFEQACGVREV